MIGTGGITAIGMIADIVAQAMGHLGHVVWMCARVVVGLAICIIVPFPKNVVLGLDRLADEPTSGLVLLEVILVAFDASGELGRVLPRIIASSIDITVVEPCR